MISWYWMIIAFLLGIVFATVTWHTVEWDNLFSNVCAGLIIPFIYIAAFPIVFFRRLIHPITLRQWERFQALNHENNKCRKVWRNIYLWHDTTTKNLYAKWFLIRVGKK